MDTVVWLLQLTIYDVLHPPWMWGLVAFGLIGARFTNGLKHAVVIYLGDKSRLHSIDFFHEGAFYVLAFASGLPVMFVAGCGMVGSTFFQVPINLATAGGMFEEEGTWDVFGVDVPKPFTGKLRLLEITLGTALATLSVFASVLTW